MFCYYDLLLKYHSCMTAQEKQKHKVQILEMSNLQHSLFGFHLNDYYERKTLLQVNVKPSKTDANCSPVS